MIIESGILESGSGIHSKIDDFRQANGYSHLANNPKWSLFVESIYGHKAYYVEIRNRNEQLAYAVGNLCRISTSGRNILVLGSFLDYGVEMYLRGSESDLIKNIEKETLAQMGPKGLITKEITPLGHLSRNSQAILDLSGHTVNTLEKHISSRARNDLRQFEIYENSIRVDNKFLPEFYTLYLKSMKEFGTPAHSINYFEKLLGTFDSRVVVSFDQSGSVTAASISICEDAVWMHMYAVGNRARRKGNPGDRILWEEMKMSVERGAQSFWLGRSVRNSAIEKYKEKWNPKFYATCEKRGTQRNPESGFQEMDKESAKSKFATTWSKLPSSVTNRINSSIRKYIP